MQVGGEFPFTGDARRLFCDHMQKENLQTCRLSFQRRNIVNSSTTKPHGKITIFPDMNGRGRRIRTLGTRFWRPLLYQLSYAPILLP